MATIEHNGEQLAIAETLLRDCVGALRRVAQYRLPSTFDQRLLWLSEHKEILSPAERQELESLVEFAEERTVEKLQAQAALERVASTWPQILAATP